MKLSLSNKKHICIKPRISCSIAGAERLLNLMKDPALQKVIEQGVELHMEESGDFAAGVNAGASGVGNIGGGLNHSAGFKLDIKILPKR